MDVRLQLIVQICIRDLQLMIGYRRSYPYSHQMIGPERKRMHVNCMYTESLGRKWKVMLNSHSFVLQS